MSGILPSYAAGSLLPRRRNWTNGFMDRSFTRTLSIDPVPAVARFAIRLANLLSAGDLVPWGYQILFDLP